MAITLTKPAAEHIQSKLDKRGYGLGLQLGIQKDGCNGFDYVVGYADEEQGKALDEYQIFESHGIKVYVDNESVKHIDGTEIDLVKGNALNQGFEFKNPNADDTCGCGESFNVKKD